MPIVLTVAIGLRDLYVSGFIARCDTMRRPGQPMVDASGVHGLLASAADPFARLLVTDDQAYNWLAAALPDLRKGMIKVFAAAARCTQLLDSRSAWKAEPMTAMLCRKVQTVPALPLPNALTMRPIRRLADDPPDGVPLKDAAALATLADPAIDGPPESFADYLRSLAPGFRLFAALDGGGAVRATSGSGAFGTQGTLLFVNTHPDWRGRGIGQAMTAAALRDARSRGATQACLDSTLAGLPIYRRLGFEVVGDVTNFIREA